MATVTGTTTTSTTDPLAGYYATQSARANSDSGEDRFLTLLVSQMRNQDPLNPLDNAQVTSQLAQINTVKGIEQMNSTLADLGLRFDAMQVLQAAAIVDRHVLVAGTDLVVSDKDTAGVAGASGAYELTGAVDSVTIRVLDGAGNAVYQTTGAGKSAGMHDFNWDGKLASGKQAAAGIYKLEITAAVEGKPVAVLPFVGTTVTALTRGTGGFALTLANGQTVGMADLRKLY